MCHGITLARGQPIILILLAPAMSHGLASEPTLDSSAGNHAFGNDKKQHLELLSRDICGMERMPGGRSHDSDAIPGEGTEEEHSLLGGEMFPF